MAASPEPGGSMMSPSTLPTIVRLNVGGSYFTTTVHTLRSVPGSRLCVLFSEPPSFPCPPCSSRSGSPVTPGGGGWGSLLQLDSEGRVFVDRDGALFGHVLAFLREGTMPPGPVAAAVHAEATFWGLEHLARALEDGPPLFGEMVARRQFCAQVPGYQENIEIMTRVARAEALASRVSRVLVHVRKSSGDGSPPPHQPPHQPPHHQRRGAPCALHGTQSLVNFGPWSVEPGVKDLLDCVKVDVEALGYRVTWEERPPPAGEAGDKGAGLAGLFRGAPPPSPSCGLYEFIFHWW